MNQTQTTEMKKTMEEIERLERELEARGVEPVAEKSTEKSSTLKRRNKSFKNSVIASIAFALISVVLFSAQTYAYFTDSETSENNTIKAGNLEITTVAAGGSVNTEPTAIMPGTEVAKGVDVKNTGSLNSYVRAKIDISIDKAGINQAELESLIQFNINTTIWKLHTDGYYYYVGGTKGVVESNDTVNLYTQIKFLPKMGNEYTNATITITVNTEAVQSDFNGEGPLNATWTETP